METLEDELVVFELCCFEESVMEDPNDQGVESVRDEGYREEIEGAERGKQRDEDLGL